MIATGTSYGRLVGICSRGKTDAGVQVPGLAIYAVVVIGLLPFWLTAALWRSKVDDGLKLVLTVV